jgi:nucleoid-associated protein YejK
MPKNSVDITASRLMPHTGAAPGWFGSPGAYSPTTIVGTLNQLAQSLDVLGRAADLFREQSNSEQAIRQMRQILQPHARQAEAALRRLRELRLANAPAATELIQCLTVLVLAADMIVQGHLSHTYAIETCELIERNAERALAGLNALRAQLLNTAW